MTPRIDYVWSHGAPLRLIRTENGQKVEEVGAIRQVFGHTDYTAYIHREECTDPVRGFATEQDAKDFLMTTMTLRGEG